MDFHNLSRRELQALCKKNQISANLTNVAMADALSSLSMMASGKSTRGKSRRKQNFTTKVKSVERRTRMGSQKRSRKPADIIYPECHPEALLKCLTTQESKKRGSKLPLNARRHLSYLGWNITMKRRSKNNTDYFYYNPKGEKRLRTLHEACEVATNPDISQVAYMDALAATEALEQPTPQCEVGTQVGVKNVLDLVVTAPSLGVTNLEDVTDQNWQSSELCTAKKFVFDDKPQNYQCTQESAPPLESGRDLLDREPGDAKNKNSVSIVSNESQQEKTGTCLEFEYKQTKVSGAQVNTLPAAGKSEQLAALHTDGVHSYQNMFEEDRVDASDSQELGKQKKPKRTVASSEESEIRKKGKKVKLANDVERQPSHRCGVLRDEKKLVGLDLNGDKRFSHVYWDDKEEKVNDKSVTIHGKSPEEGRGSYINKSAVFRPDCEDFLDFLFDNYNEDVWSSRTSRNLNPMLDFVEKTMVSETRASESLTDRPFQTVCKLSRINQHWSKLQEQEMQQTSQSPGLTD